MAAPNRWDIDTYLNPFTPRSYLSLLPRPISRFLGYRPPNSSRPAAHPVAVWAWSFLGAFLGVALIEAVYLHLPRLDDKHVPIVIASFGAAAILEYNTIESPLAQPRNLVLGHFLAALIGICITKLFQLLPESDFNNLKWLAGALSVGASSAIMSMTKTVHPPAGATALLAATDAGITDLGWWLLALIVLGSTLMLASALIINNIVRQFPMYWWTPVDLAALHRKQKSNKDIEKQARKEGKIANEEAPKADLESETSAETDNEPGRVTESDQDTTAKRQELLRRRSLSALQAEIIIAGDEIVVPYWFHANEWEVSVLRILQQRLISVSHDEQPRRSEDRKRSRSRSKSRARTG